ncbi:MULTISPECIES: MBL fold metallo-hydrolase [Actinoplanes]|uniref:MBL fold metallo-hydrolase n=1 Tax=Actinoplanes TaxID=1865 RepID=UPI0005F2967A|nr:MULTISPECIES: MBL fold metallo-hydrolase [Actinoplanes]GLY02821.1 MBL fold metallo-hydrolase [Actinoplanes sp. NBRC 101535]
MSPHAEPTARTAAPPLPEASPPAEMAIYHLPTGTFEKRAGFAVKGGSFRDKRRFAASSVLVRHPHGDLLIDAGFGTGIAEHVSMLPWLTRPHYRIGRTVREQLDSLGYDRGRLLGVLLTHTHWDHVSGLDGLRGVPIWMTAAERRHAATDPSGKVFRHVAAGHDIHEYGFTGRPHLGFPSSFDVYGDGSVVVVPAGGHTPGSVVVFVTLPTAERYAFVGDLTYEIGDLRRAADRPRLASRFTHTDFEQLRRDLCRMSTLDGPVRIVPAHDLGTYASIPRLTPEAATSRR